MTPEQVKLVQDSFAKVEPIATQAGDMFYGRLFEIAPEVRPMFPADITAQRDKLLQMLTTAVSNLHQVEMIIPAVKDLGKRHVGYGVQDAHYDKVGEALIGTLENGLGEAFTDEVKAAWVETYGTLASVMKEAAATMPPPAAEKKGLFARMFGS
ncbi:MAG: hemin receptor [Hyphomicrobiales bacterium]|nr:hemin receptor [Hyphomicrobiales bacterium]